MTKEEMLHKLNGSAKDFFFLLRDMRGASLLNEKLVEFLEKLKCVDPSSVNAQKVLHIFFSLTNDGNTCISLNPDTLLAKWKVKWEGLVMLASQEKEPGESRYPSAEDFKPIIDAGCAELLGNIKPPLVIENLKKDGKTEPYLFTEKYLDAKKIIERCFQKQDKKGEKNTQCVFNGEASASGDLKSCKDAVEAIIDEEFRKEGPNKFDLNEEQAKAIVKGESQNLIITGGPGTGKTTVVFFLLWNLLTKQTDKRRWDIYFAAPSGKAADRLRESIGETFDMLTEDAQESPVVTRLKNVDSYSTLHRLLSYNPQTNSFRYSQKTPFAEKTIFVIDEASMIDLSLFASFMQALPKKDFRLYILGDKDQLPSVEAGAVLGEILEINKDCIVELTKTNRFDKNSKIGQLSRFIQKQLEEKDLEFPLEWKLWESQMRLWDSAKIDEINLLQLSADTRALETEKLQNLLNAWAKRFYGNPDSSLLDLAKKIRPALSEDNYASQGFSDEDWNEECANREALWKLSDSARILSAERRGLRGVENLNKMLAKALGQDEEKPFDGQLMILTKNQSYFDLYNGDSGVVVNCDTRPTLMLKRKGKFVFYPISLLPTDSIETAFAITIHKAQGSGYPNIMMFLPTRKGHPLLNRQILYTGVTRTKKQSLTIVATPEAFSFAREEVIRRDTGFDFKS